MEKKCICNNWYRFQFFGSDHKRESHKRKLVNVPNWIQEVKNSRFTKFGTDLFFCHMNLIVLCLEDGLMAFSNLTFEKVSIIRSDIATAGWIDLKIHLFSIRLDMSVWSCQPVNVSLRKRASFFRRSSKCADEN